MQLDNPCKGIISQEIIRSNDKSLTMVFLLAISVDIELNDAFIEALKTCTVYWHFPLAFTFQCTFNYYVT